MSSSTYPKSLWKYAPHFLLRVCSYTNYADQLSWSILFLFPLFHAHGRCLTLSHQPFTTLHLSLLWALPQGVLHHLVQRDVGYTEYLLKVSERDVSPQKRTKRAIKMHKWFSSSGTRAHIFHFEHGLAIAFTWVIAKPRGNLKFFAVAIETSLKILYP